MKIDVTSVASHRIAMPKTIWTLGFVSMLMDISAEMVNSLLPLYMVSGLGVSVLFVGLIEGIGQSAALMIKVFSGALSDHLRKRKGIVVFGYLLSALSKPLFPLAGGVSLLMGGKILDRLGKGIREAPRDALITELVPPEICGSAFGLQKALDTVGAVLGPLLAAALLLLWANDVKLIFWIAVIPGILAVSLLIFGIKEPDGKDLSTKTTRFDLSKFKELSSGYWWVAGLGAAVTLARFSEAFLVLRAQQAGLALPLVPLIMVVMSVFYALSAYPCGKLSDRISHTTLLATGIIVLLSADMLLAIDQNITTLLVGVALWGIHMGMTQGLLSAMVATVAPARLMGTAFGLFNLLSGLAMLLASVLAGLLWDYWGATSTFLAGALFCLLALALIRFRHTRV